jgi:hypothetical protein
MCPDGENVTTPEVKVHDSSPSMPAIHIELTDEGLYCAVATPSSDADGDTITYKYEWYRDEKSVPDITGNSVHSSWLAGGETWACVVTASDGENPSVPCRDEVLLDAAGASKVTLAVPEASSTYYSTATPSNATTTVSSTSSDSAPSTTQPSTGATTSTPVTQSNSEPSSTESSDEATTPTSDDQSSSERPSATPAVVPGSINPVYVWGEMYGIIDNTSKRSSFFSVCASQGINAVWMPIDLDSLRWFDDSTGYPVEEYVSFMSQAQDRGIAVHALLYSAGGDVLLNPGNHRDYILGVLKYNQEHPDAKFAGVHFDIENCATGWADDYFMQAYISYIEDLKGWTYNGDTVESQGLMLSAYCDQLPEWSSKWYQWVREFDLIEIQAYCDTYDTILTQEHGRAAILNDAGIPFILLSELSPVSDQSTFWDEGLDYYYSVRAELQQHYAQYGEFRGFGLHYYTTLVQLMG